MQRVTVVIRRQPDAKPDFSVAGVYGPKFSEQQALNHACWNELEIMREIMPEYIDGEPPPVDELNDWFKAEYGVWFEVANGLVLYTE
jgi:hypothetical protein